VQRVVVLGPVGAGKTVLSNEIARRTGLPVVHLDPLFWREGWAPAPPEEGLRALRAAVAGERWIIDGNFLSSDEGPRTADSSGPTRSSSWTRRGRRASGVC
jgi:adenylate kinase family enzyme